ncbi:hypothetical protein [Rubellimicrobium arenae]|uniref:hypothetical protein n=1 Tax=Rubellimicrobium arenae TaxID=2817372 RepID=UPI001FEE0A2B|nr:hypothetical protein [Rubellimicrobium arenae]
MGGRVLLSASDLMRFSGCHQATAYDLQLLRDGGELPAGDDAEARILQAKGLAHEKAYLAKLKESGRPVVEIRRGSMQDCAHATRAALADGIDYVFQGALHAGLWGGWADFLERVDRPSALGTFSYEVADTKLKREITPKHVLQPVVYSDLLARVQGRAPEFAHIELGTGKRATIRLADYAAYARRAQRRLEGFVADPWPTRPIPCSDCGLCGWADRCQETWDRQDSLFNVANIARGQVMKLEDAGVRTMAELASLDHRIRGMAEALLHNLVALARVGTGGAYVGGHEQAVTCPLPHDELARVQRVAAPAWFPAGLAGPGDGVAGGSEWPSGAK